MDSSEKNPGRKGVMHDASDPSTHGNQERGRRLRKLGHFRSLLRNPNRNEWWLEKKGCPPRGTRPGGLNLGTLRI